MVAVVFAASSGVNTRAPGVSTLAGWAVKGFTRVARTNSTVDVGVGAFKSEPSLQAVNKTMKDTPSIRVNFDLRPVIKEKLVNELMVRQGATSHSGYSDANLLFRNH